MEEIQPTLISVPPPPAAPEPAPEPSDKERQMDEYLSMLSDVELKAATAPSQVEQQQPESSPLTITATTAVVSVQPIVEPKSESPPPPPSAAATPPLPPVEPVPEPTDVPQSDGSSLLVDMLQEMLAEERESQVAQLAEAAVQPEVVPPVPAVVPEDPAASAAMRMSAVLAKDLPTEVADSLDDLVSSIARLETSTVVSPVVPVSVPVSPMGPAPAIPSVMRAEPLVVTTVVHTPPPLDLSQFDVTLESGSGTLEPPLPPPVVVTAAVDAASIDDAIGDLSTPEVTREAPAHPVEPEKPAEPPSPPRDPWDILWSELSLKERLGEGSLGETNRAGNFHGMPVTVKRLRPQRFHPAFIAEFVADTARSFALPQHPNIVHILGGTTVGVVSYVCEYVSGVNLAEYAASLKKREALEARLSIAKGIAEGMRFLHENGLAHGTFKPCDVIVTDGTLVPRIRDYSYLRLKQTNLREGALFSPQYMPSEQFESNFETFSPKTDVYSFGICMWQLFEGGLGIGKLEEPAPQDGMPLKLEFESTPNEIADVIMRCCLYDPTARPDFNEIIAMLNLPTSEMLRFYEAELDPVMREQKRKLRLIAEKIVELFAGPSDFQQIKALAGVVTLARVESNAPAIWEERLHVHMLAALKSPHETVIEKTLRTLVELCAIAPFLKAVAAEATPEMLAPLYDRNDMVVMLAMRFVAMLLKDVAARQRFFEGGILTQLLRSLESANDLVVSNAALACSRLLKLSDTLDPFYAGGGTKTMIRLLRNNNPAVQVHLLNSLASMLAHEPSQESIIREGIANRLYAMLGSRSELMQLQALKSAAKFCQSMHLLENIKVTEWVEAVQRHLSGKNTAVLTAACQALANLAYNDE
jgi:hypothetical protein